MLITLVYILLFISILFIPVALMYKNGGAFENSGRTLSTYSMGNLGHSEANCIHQFIKQNDMTIGCEKGKISNIMYLGLMPKFDPEDEFEYDYCNDDIYHDRIRDCTAKVLDKRRLKMDWMTFCTGKQKCNLDFEDYVDQSNKEIVESCGLNESKVYVQFKCDY